MHRAVAREIQQDQRIRPVLLQGNWKIPTTTLVSHKASTPTCNGPDGVKSSPSILLCTLWSQDARHTPPPHTIANAESTSERASMYNLLALSAALYIGLLLSQCVSSWLARRCCVQAYSKACRMVSLWHAGCGSICTVARERLLETTLASHKRAGSPAG